MTWLLRTVASESCETTLRGQRSSDSSLATIPRVRVTSGTTFAADDDAIANEAIIIKNKKDFYAVTATPPATPSLSPLSDAHVSDYFTSTAVPRHKISVPTLPSAEILSPTITLQPSSISSCRSSSGNLITDNPPLPSASSLELLKWRLSSGFFAYFLCGWGDGGKINFSFFNNAGFIPSLVSDGHSSSLYVELFWLNDVSA